jgi:tRNA threonylcarbamoyladenosine biosynthesis protein TsaB
LSNRILAIDSTAEFGSIALAGEEILLHAPQGFGSVIFQHIERLLERTGLRLADVEAFAAAAGPGSFTGVRIGLACVKALAEAMGKPAVGVSNLQAISRYGKSEFRVPILDARRGEVYAAMYHANGRQIISETVCRFPDFLERLPDEPFDFVSQHFRPFAAALEGTRFAAQGAIEAPHALAAIIAQIAVERLASGDSGDPAAVDANYVRRSDAELLFTPPHP